MFSHTMKILIPKILINFLSMSVDNCGLQLRKEYQLKTDRDT